MKYLLVILFMIGNLYAEKIPLEVEMESAYNKAHGFWYPKLIITSLVNNIEITKLNINKGNCKFSDIDITFNRGLKMGKLLPKKLTSYQSVDVSVNQNCRVKIVDIFTNSGSYTFTF